ncbi:MAG: N-acetyltransferase family protein [Pseudomonadota bacterium]
MIVRKATIADAGAINAIYNPFIEQSPATFETEVYSLDARKAWIAARAGDARHPLFVAAAAQDDAGGVKEGALVGFANAAPFDPREGYRRSVKTSVFVAPAAHRRGVARALYAGLFEALADTDLHRAYALIVAPNAASAALHEAFGFSHVATLNEVGFKFGRFHDVMWFEKRL